MKLRSLRTAAAGLVVLVVSSLLGAAPATAAGTGTLVVNVVDQYGRPTVGVLMVRGLDGAQYYDGPGGSGFAATSSHSLTVPAGGFALQHIAPWAGLDCRGMSPCSLLTAPVTYEAATTVGAGATTTYTLHVEVPTVVGAANNGATLSVRPSDGFAALQAALAYSPFGSGVATYQWTRGGADIQGATASSYTTGPADAGHSVAARLIPSQGQILLLSSLGGVVDPLVTNSVAVERIVPGATTTKVKVPKRFGSDERVSLKAEVRAAAGVPDGYVLIRIGRFKAQRALIGGRVLVTLPRLKAGTYRLRVSYLGSTYFSGSKVRKTKVVVGRS
jgi:hypothetical protein